MSCVHDYKNVKLNPFTAMLAPLSLGERLTTVPNFESLGSFFSFARARKKSSVKMISIENRFVIGPTKYTICRRVCAHFSPREILPSLAVKGLNVAMRRMVKGQQ